jgi:DNA-binding MarR family transcriptional regulator
VVEASNLTAAPIELPNRELIEQTARFSHAFVRWLGKSPNSALSYQRLRVLEILHCRGPARMCDLADLIGLPARNFTTVADALESEDLVRRSPHPTDRRATLLELTPAGSTAAEHALAPRLAEISELFDVLTPAEKDKLQVTLKTLLVAIDRNASQP